MLYLKEKPTGIDIPIQNLQQRLYDHLRKTWGLSESDYNSFGRVYRNRTERRYVPEAYIGNGEYQETFIDDRFPVTSFFSVGETVNNNMGTMKAAVSLVFCVDLNRIKPDIKHRADEEVHFDVWGLCDMFMRSRDSIVTGIDNVFREFPGARIKFDDIHPFHCFRINLSVMYKKC